MPFYKVQDSEGKEPDRLVEAPTGAQAIKHVAQRYKATALDNSELANMFVSGAKLERAKAETDATQAALRG